MVIVDCKAVPANVVDSELFGHVKGAFPGAFAERHGRMLEADMGSLVLDEIAALPQSTQETLDRVLATGEVRPVGCNGSSSIDVRRAATLAHTSPLSAPAAGDAAAGDAPAAEAAGEAADPEQAATTSATATANAALATLPIVVLPASSAVV